MEGTTVKQRTKRTDAAKQLLYGLAVLIPFLLLCPGTAWCQEKASVLRLVQTIPLPRVTGRIDHITIDLAKQRLFVAALGNNTVEVVDLQAGQRTRSIGGLAEPQGLLYLAETNRLFVTSGGDGSLKMLDGQTFALMGTVKFPEDADNIRYDRPKRQVYIGYGRGALGIVESRTGTHIGNIPLAGHPESFQLEEPGSRIFVNVPTANHIAVVERGKRIVIGTWPLRGSGGNFPMALDQTNGRLFVGCREPAKVLVYDTESGKIMTSLDVARDIDDIFFDSTLKRLYLSCGEGFLYAFQQVDRDNYLAIEKFRTAPGARTCLFVPEHGRIYLAIPSRNKQLAQMNVYETMGKASALGANRRSEE